MPLTLAASLLLWVASGAASRAWLPALYAVCHTEALFCCLLLHGLADPRLALLLAAAVAWLCGLLVARHQAEPARGPGEPYLVMMLLTTLMLLAATGVLLVRAE